MELAGVPTPGRMGWRSMTSPSALPPPRCARCGNPPEPGGAGVPCRRCGGAAAPEPADLTRRAAFGEGLLAPFRGARFLLAHPRLLVWVLVPVLVNVLLLLVLVGAGISWSRDLAPNLGEAWWGWIDWLRGPVRWTVESLLVVFAAAAGLLLTVALSGVVNAPFFDLLSEKTEDVHLAVPDPGRPWSVLLADGLHALRAALLLLAVQVAVLAPLFLLSLTAVGAPFFFLAGAWFAGLGLLDLPMGRKRYGGRERLAYARRRWPLALGLGIPVVLLPVLAPFAVTGATLAYLDQPGKG